MKSSKIISFLLVAAVIGLAGAYFYQNNQSNQENQSTPNEQVSGETQESVAAAEPVMVEAGSYTIDPVASEVIWYGEKTLIPGGDHTGTVAVQEGMVVVDESGLITEGMIVIDMASIALSEEDTGGQRLLDHLASDDFFSTETYPTAMLEVQGSELVEAGLQLDAILTIKDIENPASFVVSREMTDTGAVLHTGTLVFDRALYDVRFGSDSFFDNLGDNVIGDDVELTFSLVAEPEA